MKKYVIKIVKIWFLKIHLKEKIVQNQIDFQHGVSARLQELFEDIALLNRVRVMYMNGEAFFSLRILEDRWLEQNVI